MVVKAYSNLVDPQGAICQMFISYDKLRLLLRVFHRPRDKGRFYLASSFAFIVRCSSLGYTGASPHSRYTSLVAPSLNAKYCAKIYNTVFIWLNFLIVATRLLCQTGGRCRASVVSCEAEGDK